ncbi:hypothetical protein GCM10010406_33460 [Streptomyces thermolineatus]|uniref:SseB protein N-terminal domain-containing protein n=1 Tax=Streptomyces thermolineatus TaxID=44033 RepID=A0ABN3M2A2_9ACTN
MSEPTPETASDAVPLPRDGASPAQEALRALAADRRDEGALTALARSEVLLPDPGGPREADPQSVQLPVFEQQDGTRLVPVFTSEARLVRVLPEIERYRAVPLALLGDNWPSEELALTIDAGSPEALTLGGQGMRALPALAGGA